MHRSELERAILNIARRRAKINDANRDRLPDAPTSDPAEVLDYLRKYSGRNIPAWVLQADVCDALTLNNWLWWEDRRRELHFLKAGRDRGLFLSQLGAQVGVGKQGVLDRIDRLEALLQYDRPDEKISRAARAAARAAENRRPAEECWICDRREKLRAVIGAMIEHATINGLEPEDREWIDELEVDVDDDNITPMTMVVLGLATAELRVATTGSAPIGSKSARILDVIARANALRSEFAGLGARSPRHTLARAQGSAPLTRALSEVSQ